MHAYADRCVWAILGRIETNRDLRASGASSVSSSMRLRTRTWLRRLVIPHMRSDSASIAAVDSTSTAQIQRRRLAPEIFQPSWGESTSTSQTLRPLPEPDASDLALCLYSALSHCLLRLPISQRRSYASRGTFITTVRPIGRLQRPFRLDRESRH